MKQRALLDCLNVKTATPAAKAVYLVLAVRSNEDNRCWPSIENLAESTCVHRSTVMRAISYLEQRGLVVADRSGRSTRYLVVSPERAQVAQCDVSHGATRRTDDLDTSRCATSEVARCDPNLQEQTRTSERERERHIACPQGDEKLPTGTDLEKWQLFREQLIVDGKLSAPRILNALGQLERLATQHVDVNAVLERAVSRGHRDLASAARDLTVELARTDAERAKRESLGKGEVSASRPAVVEAVIALREKGANTTPGNPNLIAAIAEGVSVQELTDMAEAYPGRSAGYVIAAARRQHADGTTPITPSARGRPPPRQNGARAYPVPPTPSPSKPLRRLTDGQRAQSLGAHLREIVESFGVSQQ